jgi:hypothetical protein
MSTLLEIGLQDSSYATFVHHIDGKRKLVSLEEARSILLSQIPVGQTVHKINLLLSRNMVEHYLELASDKSGISMTNPECDDIAVSFLAQDMQKIGLPMYGDPVPTRSDGWSCLIEQVIRNHNTKVDVEIQDFLATAK